ncbi:MAG: AraC family transcriptional regulator [Lachnospiraceae bacterium]
MKTNEKGVFADSEIFFMTPSDTAKELFYYTTRCGHFYCNEQYSFNGNSKVGKHPDRQTMLFMYISKGSFSLILDGEKYRIGEKQLAVIDCLQPHEYWANEKSEFFWLHIDGVNTRTFCEKIVAEKGSVFTIVKTNAFADKLEEIIYSCQPTTGSSEIVRSQMVYQMLCQTYHANASINSEDSFGSVMDEALSYIELNFREMISVEELSGHIGMSISHFSRQFKKSIGYSPHEYIILKRLDFAQGLLYSTKMSIKEIAFAAGYNSERNFIVSFRSKMGITPSRFRKLTQTKHTRKKPSTDV